MYASVLGILPVARIGIEQAQAELLAGRLVDQEKGADILVPPERLRAFLDPDPEHLSSETEQAVQDAREWQEPTEALAIDPEAATELGRGRVLIPRPEAVVAGLLAEGRGTRRRERLRSRSSRAVQRVERGRRRIDGSHRRCRRPELGPRPEPGEPRDPAPNREQLFHRLAVGYRGSLAEQPPIAFADVPRPDPGEHLIAGRELDAQAPRPGCGAGFERLEQLGRQPVELIQALAP